MFSRNDKPHSRSSRDAQPIRGSPGRSYSTVLRTAREGGSQQAFHPAAGSDTTNGGEPWKVGGCCKVSVALDVDLGFNLGSFHISRSPRRETSRACSATVRPVTAAGQARSRLESSGPPSPGRGAWGSGTHSPLVRPMSAGPFHTPLAPQVDITRVLAPQTVLQSAELSTAPLLQNIMQELKRFRNE